MWTELRGSWRARFNRITSNEQMWFKRELSICLIEFEAWWQAFGVQEIRRTIKQLVIHFGYPKIHLLSHISKRIW